MPSKITATVFIPTYNGQHYIEQILTAVYKQKTDFKFEVLIIDSGSTDRTLDIVEKVKRKHPDLRLKKIPNTEYGHGKTRNQAAELAKGEFVVYLSHDATPAHNRWLHEMVAPFQLSERVVGVLGKQIPRPHCIPMLKSEINSVFGNFGPDQGTTLFYKDDFVKDQGTYDVVTFYSDANSAARRSFVTGDIPYRDVKYAEDQLFGRDIVDQGYIKAYAPRGAVVHSNDLELHEYRARMFDETMGLRKIGFNVAVPSYKTIIKLTGRGIVRDALRIVRDRDYSAKRKLYWLVMNPAFHVAKWRGVRFAAKADLDDEALAAKHSLEKQRASVPSKPAILPEKLQLPPESE